MSNRVVSKRKVFYIFLLKWPFFGTEIAIQSTENRIYELIRLLSRDGKVTETPGDKTGNDVSFGEKDQKKSAKKKPENAVEKITGDPEVGAAEDIPDDIPTIGVDNEAYEE